MSSSTLLDFSPLADFAPHRSFSFFQSVQMMNLSFLFLSSLLMFMTITLSDALSLSNRSNRRLFSFSFFQYSTFSRLQSRRQKVQCWCSSSTHLWLARGHLHEIIERRERRSVRETILTLCQSWYRTKLGKRGSTFFARIIDVFCLVWSFVQEGTCCHSSWSISSTEEREESWCS